MTNQEFKLWIQGYLALTDDEYLVLQQLKIIRNHANLVKTMMPEIEPEILQFVDVLEKELENKRSIPMADVRKFAELMTHSRVGGNLL